MIAIISDILTRFSNVYFRINVIILCSLLWLGIWGISIAYAQQDADLYGTRVREYDNEIKKGLNAALQPAQELSESQNFFQQLLAQEEQPQEEEISIDNIPPTEQKNDLPSQIKEEKQPPLDLDPISHNFLVDALTALRFVAISLDNEEDIGLAYSGIARSFIIREQIRDAVNEAEKIKDPLWQARTYLSIAEYYMANNKSRNAIRYLREASDIFNDDFIANSEFVLRRVANNFAILGRLKDSILAVSKISDIYKRIDAIRTAARNVFYIYNLQRSEAALLEKEDDADIIALTKEYEDTFNVALEILRQATKELETISDVETNDNVINLYMDLGSTFLSVDAIEDALYAFDFAESLINKLPLGERQERLSLLAAKTVPLGDIKNSMRLVRQIDAAVPRAIALASVAVAHIEDNNLDAALPLFTLAKDTIKFFPDNFVRNKTLTRIMLSETQAGRFADAFTTAGLIDNPYFQSRSLFAMAQLLINEEKYKEALILNNYIPFVSMRSQISAAVAYGYGQRKENKLLPLELSEILEAGIEDTNMPIENSDINQAIARVLTAQILVGDKNKDLAIFDRCYELIDATQVELDRVLMLVLIARAYAARGYEHQATILIDQAFRQTWLNRQEWLLQAGNVYSTALAAITRGLLDVDNIFAAFDIAASIPLPNPEDRVLQDERGRYSHPRYRAMQAIAVKATRNLSLDLAIRAANEIEFSPARAQILSDIAISAVLDEKRNFDRNILGFNFQQTDWLNDSAITNILNEEELQSYQ
jgi:hypothetical protein